MIVTFDPSLNETGWAYGGHDSLAASGVIRTRGTTDAEKLYDLAVEIRGVLNEVTQDTLACLSPKDVTVAVEVPESFTYGRSARRGRSMNAASMMKLSRAIGVILSVVQAVGCRVVEIPACWKAQAGKDVSLLATGKNNHNEADAVLLYGWFRMNEGAFCDAGTGKQITLTELLRTGKVKLWKRGRVRRHS